MQADLLCARSLARSLYRTIDRRAGGTIVPGGSAAAQARARTLPGVKKFRAWLQVSRSPRDSPDD